MASRRASPKKGPKRVWVYKACVFRVFRVFRVLPPTDTFSEVPELGSGVRVARVQLRVGSRGRLRIWEPAGLSRSQARP